MERRWFSGGNAFELAPTAWQAAVATEPDERERRLAAIAGQSMQVLFRPAIPPNLVERGTLPLPGLPIVSERGRVLFRTALKLKQHNADVLAGHLLGLLESRGLAAHPLDWMPDDRSPFVPDVYLPLAAWVAGRAVQGPAELTADTWGDFLPAARRSALSAIRANDPARALALMTEKIVDEPAEVRAGLLDVLDVGLSDLDAPLLEKLLSDRSGKVRAQVKRRLARLGRVDVSEYDAGLAKSYIREGRAGIFRRRLQFEPLPIKEGAETAARDAFFRGMTLAIVARTMGSEDIPFLQHWKWNSDSECDHALVRLVERTGSQAAVDALGNILLADDGELARFVWTIVPRLPLEMVRRWQERSIDDDKQSYWGPLYGDLRVYGWMPAERVLSSRAFKDVVKACRNDASDLSSPIEGALMLVSLLASAEAATRALVELEAAGMSPTEPYAVIMRLNATLTDLQ